MPTTADAPSHDEENERDRLSLQNHVIRFGNEATSDEVKETILAETSAIQGGDDGIFLYMQSSEILFLSRCTRPKKSPLFTLWRFETSLGLLLVCPYVRRGGQKITVTALNHRPLSCFLEFCFFGEILNCDQHNYPRSTLVTPLPRWPHPNFLYLWSPFSLSY